MNSFNGAERLLNEALYWKWRIGEWKHSCGICWVLALSGRDGLAAGSDLSDATDGVPNSLWAQEAAA